MSDGAITLNPVTAPTQSQGTVIQEPFAVVRSNMEFEQGTIELKVWLPDSTSKCQIILGGGSSVEVFAGLNISGAQYGFATFRNGLWETIATTGYGGLIQPECWHQIKVHVQGSNLDLYFNGVKVASSSYTMSRGSIGLFFQSFARVVVKDIEIKTQVPECFVVMQFTDEYNSLYAEVIRPTCEEFGYRVTRADDFYTSGLIIDDITRSIRECTIVIADVTPNNPNVFYEVGFAHGIKKPTILLSDRKREKLPFDLSGFRTLFYDNTIGGKRAVEERLRRHLEAFRA